LRSLSTTGLPPLIANVSDIVSPFQKGVSPGLRQTGQTPLFPRLHSFVPEPPQLAALPQPPASGELGPELDQTQLEVAPGVGDPVAHAILDRRRDGLGARGIGQLDMELDRVVVAGAQNADLPVARDAGQVVEQLFEEPRAEIAHPAV